MHPNTGDIWYAKSGDNVRNYHSKRKAPNTRQKKRYPRLRLLSLQIKQLAKGHKKSKASPKTRFLPILSYGRRKISWPQNHMGHETEKRGPYYRMGDEKFRGPSTIWATKRKSAAHMQYGRRNFSWPIRGNWTSLLFFRRPIFGLRVSDVENIFAAHCLGCRKCIIGRRYSPWPKTLFLVVNARSCVSCFRALPCFLMSRASSNLYFSSQSSQNAILLVKPEGSP